VLNVKSCQSMVALSYNHTQQNAFKLVYKIYIFDFYFCLKIYLCSSASIN
jgi:hypothetical protein